MNNDIKETHLNYELKTGLDRENLLFHPISEAPFEVDGLLYENGRFRRMPEEVARKVSPGVYEHHDHAAGGRLRFITDSAYVALHVQLAKLGDMHHFPLTGSGGFDLYIKEEEGFRYFRTFHPEVERNTNYEQLIDFPDGKKKRELLFHFPTYSSVSVVFVGLEKDAGIEPPTPYRYPTPVVYYGSSITQGGCCSRPGNTYQSILSREFDCEQVNLGFSGNAKGEKVMQDYLASLEMSAFVLDYDHNAPDPAHLSATHKATFDTVRKAHPDIPIILMNRPKLYLTEEEEERKQIVIDTFKSAKVSGDQNVYFVDNEALTALCKNEGTVDSTHPTDFGFYSMAAALSPVFRQIFK